MQHALVIIGFAKGPDGDDEKRSQHDCYKAARDIAASSPTVEALAPGVWLIPLESALSAFCALVAVAAEREVPCLVHVSETRPTFLKA